MRTDKDIFSKTVTDDNMNLDFPELERIIREISEKNSSKLLELDAIREQANARLKKLAILSNKELCQQLIVEQKHILSHLSSEFIQHEQQLESAKNTTQLLQQQLKDLNIQNQDFNFDLDEKFNNFVNRETLNQLHANAEIKATKDKAPLKTSTKTGEIRALEEKRKKLVAVIASMEQDCAKQEKEQAERRLERKQLEESLLERQKELVTCCADEEKKKSAFDKSVIDLNAHQVKTQQQTDHYTSTIKKYKKQHDTATSELSNLEASKVNLESAIRSTTVAIQNLGTQRLVSRTIEVDEWQEYQEYNGWIQEKLGNPYRTERRLVRVNKTIQVEDTNVVVQINQKNTELANLQASLNSTNAQIENKKTEIAGISSAIEKEEAAWVVNKNQLHLENCRLQDANSVALKEHTDAVARREQKENEIKKLEKEIVNKKMKL